MTLNSSGPISLGGATAGQSVNLELGFAATATITMNTTAVRTLAGFPTAGTQYSMSNFYGKSNVVNISYTFTTNTANAALNVSTIGGYSSGKSNITITVNSGIYLYATATTGYGLNLTGGTTGDTVTLVNNGYIIGQGGPGSTEDGGPALNVGIGVNITINNTNASAYIAGGGGCGRARNGGPGGGAGGGSVSGAGGGPGASGANGNPCFCSCSGSYQPGGGGGGGRILPGTGGGINAGLRIGLGGGSGGGGGGASGAGSGGSANAAGGFGNCMGGGGGGWGASGGGANVVGAGGVGGKAVNLNGKTVTWTSGNTTRVWGAVS